LGQTSQYEETRGALPTWQRATCLFILLVAAGLNV